MNKDIFYQTIHDAGVIPVVKLEIPSLASPLAKALFNGGIGVIEITFRTACASEAIRRIKAECPQILLGAGTIITKAQVCEAKAAGAQFCVAPGLNPEIVQYCQEQGMFMLPGVMTPSEIEKGLSLGLDVFKFFPAHQAGGLPMLKALRGPYRGVRFVPTGGISLANAADYLSYPGVLAVGGSFLCESRLVEAENFPAIQALAAQAAQLAAGARLSGGIKA